MAEIGKHVPDRWAGNRGTVSEVKREREREGPILALIELHSIMFACVGDAFPPPTGE